MVLCFIDHTQDLYLVISQQRLRAHLPSCLHTYLITVVVIPACQQLIRRAVRRLGPWGKCARNLLMLRTVKLEFKAIKHSCKIYIIHSNFETSVQIMLLAKSCAMSNTTAPQYRL